MINLKNAYEIRSIINNKIIDKIEDELGRIIYESWKDLTISGVPPLMLNKSKGVDLLDYKIYGDSVQNGTPTPDAAIEVESVGEYDETTGKYKIPVKVSNGIEEIITHIYLNEPLRKTGDYADYIDFAKGKIIRNIKEVYAHTLSWNYRTDYELFTVETTDGITRSELGDYISYCTHYALYKDQFGHMPDKHFHHPSNWWSSRSYFVIKDTNYTDTTSFKNHLRENNTMLYYILATPTEETIELPNIPTIKGTCILEVDTSILPSNLEAIYKGK